MADWRNVGRWARNIFYDGANLRKFNTVLAAALVITAGTSIANRVMGDTVFDGKTKSLQRATYKEGTGWTTNSNELGFRNAGVNYTLFDDDPVYGLDWNSNSLPRARPGVEPDMSSDDIDRIKMVKGGETTWITRDDIDMSTQTGEFARKAFDLGDKRYDTGRLEIRDEIRRKNADRYGGLLEGLSLPPTTTTTAPAAPSGSSS